MISVDSRNVVAVLDGLVDQELLDRQIDDDDRRRRILTLTRKGQVLAGRLADAAERTERGFLAGLSDADQARLNRLLRTLHTALTD